MKYGNVFIVKPHESKEKDPFMIMEDKFVINDSRKLIVVAMKN